MRPIVDVAKDAGIDEDFLEVYGKYMAKISLNIRKKLGKRKGKIILVTATNPTPAGEGKTTNSIGFSMAFNALGHKAVVTLRQPSLGPVFGVKGGADVHWRLPGCISRGESPFSNDRQLHTS